MAHKSFEAGYRKYFSHILDKISHASTEKDIKEFYANCASSYDEVKTTGTKHAGTNQLLKVSFVITNGCCWIRQLNYDIIP